MRLPFDQLHCNSGFVPFYVIGMCRYRRKTSPPPLADPLNYIGEGYCIESILEAVLRFLQHRRHASLDVAADPTSLILRIAMNRECRRRRAGAIDIQ